MYRLQTTSGTCEEKVTWRKCIENEEVNVDVITVYNNASATCCLDKKKVQQLTNKMYHIFENQRGQLEGRCYGFDLEHTGDTASSWAEINGIRLTRDATIAGFTKVQLHSIYRSIMKWDEEARCRSSGSESESDSDCDNSKPKRNNWIYAGSTVNFHGNCKLTCISNK